MYRGRTWTMRQFAGFGTAEETNERFHYLIDEGQTDLSVAFDMPSLMGLDSDDRMSQGEVGKEGVAVDTLQDMGILFDGIDLGEVSTSFTINRSAPVIYAMYLALADRQGLSRDEIWGTLQNDMLKEFIGQKEWVVPPAASLDVVTDVIEFGVEDALADLRTAIENDEGVMPAIVDAVKVYASMSEIMGVFEDHHGPYQETVGLA